MIGPRGSSDRSTRSGPRVKASYASSDYGVTRRPVCHLLCLCLCRVSVFSLSRHRNCSGARSRSVVFGVFACVRPYAFSSEAVKSEFRTGYIQQLSQNARTPPQFSFEIERYPNNSGNTIIRIIPVIWTIRISWII